MVLLDGGDLFGLAHDEDLQIRDALGQLFAKAMLLHQKMQVILDAVLVVLVEQFLKLFDAIQILDDFRQRRPISVVSGRIPNRFPLRLGDFEADDSGENEPDASETHGCYWFSEEDDSAEDGASRPDTRPYGIGGADG